MTDQELIERIVVPMVQERSREPGDAWDAAAKALMRRPQRMPDRDEIARAIDAEPFDPPNHWTLGNVKAGLVMARRKADAVLALFQPS